MTILFDCSAIVKPRPFGSGILASRPSYRLPCTAGDVVAMARVFGELADEEAALDRDYDSRAWEAAAIGRLERGHCL